MLAVMSHALLLLYHFIFSFISSVSFGIVCDVPRKTLVTGGIIGAIGWCGYWEMWSHGHSVFMSSLVCSLLLDEYGNSAKIFLNSFYGAIGLAVGIIIADSIFRVVLKPLLNKKVK